MIEAAVSGRLWRDAELKTSKSGSPYLRMSIRVDDGDTVQTWLLCFDNTAIETAGTSRRMR